MHLINDCAGYVMQVYYDGLSNNRKNFAHVIKLEIEIRKLAQFAKIPKIFQKSLSDYLHRASALTHCMLWAVNTLRIYWYLIYLIDIHKYSYTNMNATFADEWVIACMCTFIWVYIYVHLPAHSCICILETAS